MEKINMQIAWWLDHPLLSLSTEKQWRLKFTSQQTLTNTHRPSPLSPDDRTTTPWFFVSGESLSARAPPCPSSNTCTYNQKPLSLFQLTSIITEESPLGSGGHRRSPDADWFRVASVGWTWLLVEAPVPADSSGGDGCYCLSTVQTKQSRLLTQYMMILHGVYITVQFPLNIQIAFL